jgi:N-acetylmuramoyl-L-alanine amidase
MNPEFVDGNLSLADIELAIRYHELTYLRATGSSIGHNGDQQGNWVTFEHSGLWRELKLTIASEQAPDNHEKAWTAPMRVGGSTRDVTAWRQRAATEALAEVDSPGVESTQLAAFGNPAQLQAEALPDLRAHASASRYSVEGDYLIGSSASPVKQLSSPNQSKGNSRKYLLIHYTAGTTLEGVVSWFMNPAARASAHLVVARDGSVVQMVPLSRRAWHAGTSEWRGVGDLNRHSIGIEIVNAGQLRQTARGWVNWAEHRIPDDEVTIATHKNEVAQSGWHEYTAAQIDTVLELGVALHQAFGFEDVLGHDDVSPGRKIDPGPLFPMSSIRSRLFGRA